MNAISTVIKSARKAKKMTQGELGKKVGLPQSHISQIESGRIDLRLSSLHEIARILDLELMFVPREWKQAVRALIAGDDLKKRAWRPDDEMDIDFDIGEDDE